MNELELHLKARTPLLYVVSAEEERFQQELEQACIRERRKLFVHTITEGLQNAAFMKDGFRLSGKRGPDRSLKDPMALLEHVKTAPENHGVFLLADFPDLLGDGMVRRLLRDACRACRARGNTVVLLSPALQLPRTLEADVKVLDFALPTAEVLDRVLTNACEALEGRMVEVSLSQGDRERLVQAGLGLSLEEFEGALARAVVESGRVDGDTVRAVFRAKRQILRRSGTLEFFDTRETLDTVGGLPVLKQWLAKRRRAFSEAARAYGLPSPKGLLMIGVPGCGKSLTAKAAASLWKLPLLRLDSGRLFSSQVGSSEENARRAVRVAESLAPCILWVDEIEKAMAGLGSSSQSDAGTAARVFATLATWLQEKEAPVFVMATANSVTSLPPELFRKGRWDEIFFLDLPGREEREAIFRIHLLKRHRDPGAFDLGLLAEKSDGCSGAEIEGAVTAGLFDSFDEERALSTEDLLRNLASQVPLSVTMKEQIEALRMWARTRARFASEDRIEEQRKQWRNRDIRTI